MPHLRLNAVDCCMYKIGMYGGRAYVIMVCISNGVTRALLE